ncbi:MAG: hypothetical protein GX079_05435 [Tissierellia bacterium]|nr:hypothetical protein [Tissierellia bacterium]
MAIEYRILKEGGTVSKTDSGWTLEINLISFNGLEAKYDIRQWSPGRERMSKGVRLGKNELEVLIELAQQMLSEDS